MVDSGLYIVSVIEALTVTITHNMYKNVFEENSEKCTAQSQVKDSFRGGRPVPGANSWFPRVVMSTWTPQSRAFTIKYKVKLAVVSHIGFKIGCSSVAILTASEYWKEKRKKRMVGNPLRIKPITKNPLMRHQGCLQSSLRGSTTKKKYEVSIHPYRHIRTDK